MNKQPSKEWSLSLELTGPNRRLRDVPLAPLPPRDALSVDGWGPLSARVQWTLPPEDGSGRGPERRYVQAVIGRYLWLPDTPTETSRHDRRLARELFKRRVPLRAVEAALLMASSRRALREPWLGPLPRIRAMHFFLPVIAEMLDNPPGAKDIDYYDALLRRLRPLAELKLARIRHEDMYGGEDR